MEMRALLEGARSIASQDAAIPALRVSLLLLGILGSHAWLKRRPTLALSFLAVGGFLALGYWLIQIATPLGLGTDGALTSQWAQAGVNSLAGSGRGGFVWGTPDERSLLASLASAGAPRSVVFATPQIAALLCLALLALGPWTLFRNPLTAAFAGSLALGGGLWPGFSPFAAMVVQPAGFLGLGAVFLAIVVSARAPWARRWFHRRRLAVAMGLIALAVLIQAWSGGAEAGAVSSLSLACASIILAPALRATARLLSSSPSSARRMEALVVLVVFAGSGVFWWNPAKTLSGFAESRDGGTRLRAPLGWIARNVPPGEVVLASPGYSAQVAAFGAHRVLFPPLGGTNALPEPFRRSRLYESVLEGQPIARLAEAFSVTHLFLGPGEPTPPAPAVGAAPDEPRLSLVLVYHDAEDFRVFRLANK